MGNETDDKREKYKGSRTQRGKVDALVTDTKERMSRCELGGMSDTLGKRRLREKRLGEGKGTSGLPAGSMVRRRTLRIIYSGRSRAQP